MAHAGTSPGGGPGPSPREAPARGLLCDGGMKILVPFLSILAVSLGAAFSAAACSKTVSITDFDTSCQKAGDCIAVYIGPPECCAGVNAAINASDQAKYDAEIAAQDKGFTCNVACFRGLIAVPVCSAGTCEVTFVDGGPTDAGAAECGSTSCTSDQVCVSELVAGGAVVLPDDAGACPVGKQNVGGICQPQPTYHCVATPPACGAGLSCACAQAVCDGGFTCQQASAGLVQCVEAVP